ncbi:AAA family ATPase [Sandarakinorhabdus oryzae]|uniref:AAA family ATPase n=1 Tax=Sandarakinorhabdus oryzae TaxID=2675220 RepID=UPI0012E0D3B9|nr:ATP-binding protein [Sandarakinorhabdus oryzae]
MPGRSVHVCFAGVESTGKTRLAERLARRMGAALMPEYGREYAETIGTDFTAEALRSIARTHEQRRQVLLATRPRLLIEDTDVVMTAAWFRMLHGRRDPELSAMAANADLYLLFAPDTPWVADGTRQFVGRDRLQFQAIIEDELASRDIEPVLIMGSWQQRERQATAAITRRLDSVPQAAS